MPVTPPPSLDPADPVRIRAKLTYLVCETECVPGSADLALTLPVGEAEPDPAHAALFDRARAALPEAGALAAPPVEPGRHASRLDFAATGLNAETIRNAAYFPYSETAIDNAAAQVLSVDAIRACTSPWPAARPPSPHPDTLPGVLDPRGGDRRCRPRRLAFGIRRRAGARRPPQRRSPAPAAGLPRGVADLDALTLATAAAFAFLGGLILNLMPCVFPVLSIKVLSLVRHAGESPAAAAPARPRLHGRRARRASWRSPPS